MFLCPMGKRYNLVGFFVAANLRIDHARREVPLREGD